MRGFYAILGSVRRLNAPLNFLHVCIHGHMTINLVYFNHVTGLRNLKHKSSKIMKESMRQIIRRLRKERGFTQEELAEQLNITYQAVSRWENETGLPDISQVVPLANVLGVTADVLFGMQSKKTTKPKSTASLMRWRRKSTFRRKGRIISSTKENAVTR